MRITVKAASRMMECSEQYTRIGLQRGLLPIGSAVKLSGRWTYVINSNKLAEHLGVSTSEVEEWNNRIKK